MITHTHLHTHTYTTLYHTPLCHRESLWLVFFSSVLVMCVCAGWLTDPIFTQLRCSHTYALSLSFSLPFLLHLSLSGMKRNRIIFPQHTVDPVKTLKVWQFKKTGELHTSPHFSEHMGTPQEHGNYLKVVCDWNDTYPMIFSSTGWLCYPWVYCLHWATPIWSKNTKYETVWLHLFTFISFQTHIILHFLWNTIEDV